MMPGDTHTRSQAAAPPPLTSGAYADLPSPFFESVAPTPVASPALIQVNEELARDLGLSVEWLASAQGVETLAGNRPFPGAAPFAMAYAGHQFGNFVPSLGDGRAIQIGEAIDRRGRPRPIQLKGAGLTPFSRQGDGRAAIGPVLREYVLSEAMSALGIPTTRALALVTTGETVHRDRPEKGAILTRVAADFVRVGTFEYFAARGMDAEIRALADYVIARRGDVVSEQAPDGNPYRALLERAIESQAELIAGWMLIGFVHGVMNTDNMSIMGETIDYGPCAFLDDYVPNKVFSSIDHAGRYAYHQQPGIGLWNLTRFAETLLPLLGKDEESAVASAKEALAQYAERFRDAYEEGLLRKIGLDASTEANRELAFELLDTMAAESADFTLTFRTLSELDLSHGDGDGDGDGDGEQIARLRALFDTPEAIDAWLARWRERLRDAGVEEAERMIEMRGVNPLFIPRNHLVEQAIEALAERDDRAPLDALLTVTTRPFEEHTALVGLAAPPRPEEIVERTFCGT